MKAYYVDAGKISYPEGLKLQEAAFNARAAGRLKCDVLFLLEHTPVITMGRLATPDMLRVQPPEILKQGVEIYRTTRGGKVTYHGPGQVVAYPVLDFFERKKALSPLTEESYSEKLEQVLVNVGRQYVPGLFKRGDKDPETKKRYVGAWFWREKTILKVGAVGWELKPALGHMISMHGFALNVDLAFPEHFELIDPCGLKGIKAASLAELCRHEISVSEVKEKMVEEFARVFGYEFEQLALAEFYRRLGILGL